jgi:phosphinothricin acetyltransferase
VDIEDPRQAINSSHISVRQATDADLDGINALYNQYVLDTHYTFDIEPLTSGARREWFTHYGTVGRHRVFVALSGDDVVGFTSSGRY